MHPAGCISTAIIDCCTREIVGWQLSLRCRATEAITVIQSAVAEQHIAPGTLTLGTDNGSAFTARATRLVLYLPLPWGAISPAAVLIVLVGALELSGRS